MSIQDENKNDAKTKIEQIRRDLEKKISAIENNNNNDISNEIDDTKIEIVNDTESNPVFEISEPIISIDKVVKNNDLKNEVVKDSVLKEADNIDKTVEKEKSKETEKELKPKAVPLVNKSTIVQSPETIASSLSPNKENEVIVSDKVQEEEFIKEEKKSKKGILSFVFYGLLIALFVAIGYMVVDYMKQNDELTNEKMRQKLSEFKNKRYLDSVELAELNYQLEDLQTKKMLDSLDRLNELLLLSKISNSNNKTKTDNNNKVKRNFNNLNKVGDKISNSNNNSINDDLVKSNGLNTHINSSDTKLTNKNTSLGNNNVALSNNSTDNNILNKNNNKIDNKEDASSDNKINSNLKTVANNDINKSENNTKDEKSSKVKIKKAPIYPGCEKKKTEYDIKKCLSSKMYKHILRKFNSEVANNSGLKDGIHQVRVSYIIDKAGYATVLNVRGESKALEAEAIRVIQSLPKMAPGTIDGKQVKTMYNIPIKFNVSN